MYIFVYIFVSYAIVFAIFWCIFYFVGFLIKKKYSADEKLIYECGFKNFSNLQSGFNLNFFWSAALILMYELEIIFVLPVLINNASATPASLSLAIFFASVLNMTVFGDIKLKISKWSY